MAWLSQDELAKQEAEIKSFEGMVGALEGELQASIRELDARLEEEAELARRDLAARKAEWALAAAKALAEERKRGLGELDRLREQVNTLALAFQKRSTEARSSHRVHKLAVGVFALEEAMANGRPVQAAVNLLQEGSAADGDSATADLVRTVVGSLPPDVLADGVTSREELLRWFGDVRGAVAKVALVPGDGGGLVSHLLSAAASYVRLGGEGLASGSSSVEGALAQVEGLVAAGELRAAADALEERFAGTQGGRAAAAWIKAARDRAVAEQAAKVLVACAASVSASLS